MTSPLVVADWLQNWREIIVLSQPFLIWTDSRGPVMICSVVTFCFLCVWYWQCTLVSTLAGLMLIVTLLDYAVLCVHCHVFDAEQWSSQQQRCFMRVCESLYGAYSGISSIFQQLAELKQHRPNLYVCCVGSGFLMITYIGAQFDNLLLTYFMVLFGCLYPGMAYTGILKRHTAATILFITGNTSAKNCDKKSL